jgi:hypothetical protein
MNITMQNVQKASNLITSKNVKSSIKQSTGSKFYNNDGQEFEQDELVEIDEMAELDVSSKGSPSKNNR